MSQRLVGPVRRRSRKLAWAASLLALGAAALLGTQSLASASTPVTGAISVTGVTTSSIKDQNGDPAQLVVRNVPFTLAFDLAPAQSSNTKVTLSVTSGPDKGLVLGSTTVPAGTTSWTIDGNIPTAANNVGLKLTTKSPGVLPGTTTVNVLKAAVFADASDPKSSLTGIGGGGGVGTPCVPTPTDQTCGDLVLPSGVTVTGAGELLTQGSCDGICTTFTGGSVLEWLAGLSGASTTNPAVFIAKCDKSLCAGKGIKSYTVSVQATGMNSSVTSPACLSKGVVDSNADPKLDFCTDYVQSTRDGAGDVLLYVLFAKDAKINFG